MKKHMHFTITGLMTIILTLSLITGCSITDPTDDFKIHIEIPEGGPVISAQFTDAGTGYSIQGTTVNVSIRGDDSLAVVDLLNEHVQSFSTSIGIISFAINDTITPTVDDPVDFTIIASADGFITSSRRVHLTNADDHRYFISMLNPGNLPDGTAGSQNSDGQADGSGQVTTPIIIEVDEPNEGRAASGSVEAGTIITDRNGNPLSGTLNTTFIFSPVSTDTSLDAELQEIPFPNGYDVPYEDEDGNVIYNSPLNADAFGFISMNITDDSGNEAHHFDPPLTLSAEIADDPDLDPENQLAPGDSVEFNSFDVVAGVWRYEGIAIVEDNGNGKIGVSYQTDHLSDWRIPKPSRSKKNRLGFSEKSFGFQIINLEGYNVARLTFYLYGAGSLKRESFDYNDRVWFNDMEMLNYNDRWGFGELYEVRVYIENPSLSHCWEADDRNDYIFIEDDSTYVFDFGFPPAPGRLSLTLIGDMPDDHRLDEIRPSGITCMWLKETDPPNNDWVTVGTMVNGYISIGGLEVDSRYTFRGVYQNGDQQETADENNVLIEQLPWEYEYHFEVPDEYAEGL